MGLPDDWTLHRVFNSNLSVDVDGDGIWINYGSHDAQHVSWEELDAIRPFTEVTKPGKFYASGRPRR